MLFSLTTSNGSYKTKLLYTQCIFLSAFLLFWIQPVIGKKLLPVFGGSTFVWASTLIFFQASLFLGYSYVYLLTKARSLKFQLSLHFLVMSLALWKLHRLMNLHFIEVNTSSPVVAILEQLLQQVGLPIFIVSVSAPILQYWYSKKISSEAKDPYFLYSASNLGSVLACISFPILLEPFLSLSLHLEIWTAIFVCYCLGVFAILFSLRQERDEKKLAINDRLGVLSSKRVLSILILSAVPSAMLVSITQQITLDVGSIPLLWLLPLISYLLTFVIAFNQNNQSETEWVYRNFSIFISFMVIKLIIPEAFSGVVFEVFSQVCGFFILSYACHLELVANRPQPALLPLYYVLLALGGLLGGMCIGLVIPVVTKSLIEYRILIVCSIALLQFSSSARKYYRFSNKINFKSDIVFLIGFVLSCWLVCCIASFTDIYTVKIKYSLRALLVLSIFWYLKKPLMQAFCIATLFMVFSGHRALMPEAILVKQTRNHYGVKKIYQNPRTKLNTLIYNTTIHGSYFDDGRKVNAQALSYYQVVYKTVAELYMQRDSISVGVVGLGTGTVNCAFAAKDKIDFFELDPEVLTIARDSSYFGYLSDCQTQQSFYIGDGRMSLRKMHRNKYHMLILDAFSSDAIPTHLLTKEAFYEYLEVLKQDGYILVHISNRYFNLLKPLQRIANYYQLNLYQYFKFEKNHVGLQASQWVMMTRKKLQTENTWKRVTKKYHGIIWRDNYTNVLSAFNYQLNH